MTAHTTEPAAAPAPDHAPGNAANAAGNTAETPTADAAARDARECPVADWVTIDALHEDPYPIYRRMREEAPVHWVPAVNRYMVVGYHACHEVERDAERFTADERESLMKRAMGHSMLRKDDPEHKVERDSYGATLRPATIKKHWNEIFERHHRAWLDHLKEQGPGADFVWDYAAPYAADNLRAICGFRNATQQDLQRWSQTMINGTGNYADDPEVWALSERSSAEVDEAIDEMLPYYREHPDASLLSALSSMPIPLEAIRANLKMTIGGGLNEPRDVLSTTVWALLDHPDQLARVREDPKGFRTAFEESIRWVAPIGMYPREVVADTVLDGVRLPAGARLGVVVGAANRDPAVWQQPESFDVYRESQPHLAFGGGQHFCAGAWVGRASVAQIAMPSVFEELPNLRLDPERPARITGWVFRGMTEMPVLWG